MIIFVAIRKALVMSCVTTRAGDADVSRQAGGKHINDGGHDRVEARGGLIAENQLGIKRQRPREADALFHSRR